MNEVSLRDFIESKFDAHEREHGLLAEALALNNTMVKEWRESANEWRATLTDLTGRFATREFLDEMSKSLAQRVDNAMALTESRFLTNAKRIEDLERANVRVGTQTEERHMEALKVAEKQRAETTRQQWIIGAAISIFAVLASVLSRIVFQ